MRCGECNGNGYVLIEKRNDEGGMVIALSEEPDDVYFTSSVCTKCNGIGLLAMKCGECKAFDKPTESVGVCKIASKASSSLTIISDCIIDKMIQQRDALNAKEAGDEAQSIP